LSANVARRRALRAFGKRLGLRDAAKGDCALVDTALTHDSYAHEQVGSRHIHTLSNERLEFLGDAVLGHAVARALYDRHPDEPEGVLSRRRAALVSRDALAATARRLDVAPLLLLGKGEAAAGGERRPSILAAVFEALVGAVYLSEGFDAAGRFVTREHLAHAADPDAADPKTMLQEYAQARFKRPPTYAVTLEAGPAHAKTFTIAVSVGDAVMGTGSGPTKKQAQAEAAAQALRTLSAKARTRRGNDRST
jgi:ribonuclease-3